MSRFAMDISCSGIHGRDVGRFVKNALNKPRAVDVIFAPGLGAVRENEAYELWQDFSIWFNILWQRSRSIFSKTSTFVALFAP